MKQILFSGNKKTGLSETLKGFCGNAPFRRRRQRRAEKKYWKIYIVHRKRKMLLMEKKGLLSKRKGISLM